MIAFVNGVVFESSTIGTGTFAVSTAALGWQTPEQAGAADGATYRYRAAIRTNEEWEVGTGVYDATAKTLTRDVVEASTNANNLVDFTDDVFVTLTIFAEDYIELRENQTGGSEVVITSDTTITNAHRGKYIIVDSVAPVTLTMSSPAILGANWVATFKSLSGVTNIVGTFDDGEAIQIKQHGSVVIQCNGTVHRSFLINEFPESFVPKQQSILGNGGATYTLSSTPNSKEGMIVWVGGSIQTLDAFEIDGNQLTLDDNVPLNDPIVVFYFQGNLKNTLAVPLYQIHPGTGSAGPFTLLQAPTTPNALDITISGIGQPRDGSAYNVVGNQITFSSPILSSWWWEEKHIVPVAVATTANDSIEGKHIKAASVVEIREKLGLGADTVIANIKAGSFIGNGTVGPYTLPASALNTAAVIELIIGGYVQAPSAIASVVGNQLTMTEAIINGIECSVKVITQVSLGAPSVDTVGADELKTSDVAAMRTKLGAIGGQLVLPGTDLNTRLATDITGFQSTETNLPGFSYGSLLTTLRGGSEVTQLAIGVYGQMSVRGAPNGTFNAWRKLYKEDNILGTVSQTAGVPTGSIIERGSNANGEYTKFADGTLICFNYVTGTPVANVDLYTYWTFPSLFSAGAHCTMGYEPYSTQSYTVSKACAGSAGVSSSTLVFNTSVAQQYRLTMTAIGRWF